jgi:sucrose phosphorylase
MLSVYEQLIERVEHHLNVIYQDVELDTSYSELSKQLLNTMRVSDPKLLVEPKRHHNNWDQKDVMLITYGDSIEKSGEKPLHSLHSFLTQYCGDAINSVHLLPFFPYSSDDGFSVIDYSSVNEALGDWDDIQAITQDYRVMSDVVINHCSSRSAWFENFIKGEGPGSDFFFTASLEDDLSDVVRPRTSDVLRLTETAQGEKQVWCTFSHDQVDFDFRNPAVLNTFVSIMRQYLDTGIRLFRLDAVAFLCKKIGTSFNKHEQTHEVIRFVRSVIEHT